MDGKDTVGYIKKVIHELSETNKVITLQQVIEASGCSDPRDEIETLVKKGIIIKLSSEEFRWV